MKPHILIVEDNLATRELYVDMLTAYGYTTQVMRTGQEVIDYFDEPDPRIPDVLILDINLPERNGVYVLKYLRGKLNLGGLKILVVTANHIAGGMPEMELADMRLIKPFLPHELTDAISKILKGEVDSAAETATESPDNDAPVAAETTEANQAEAQGDETMSAHAAETQESKAITPAPPHEITERPAHEITTPPESSLMKVENKDGDKPEEDNQTSESNANGTHKITTK